MRIILETIYKRNLIVSSTLTRRDSQILLFWIDKNLKCWSCNKTSTPYKDESNKTAFVFIPISYVHLMRAVFFALLMQQYLKIALTE